MGQRKEDEPTAAELIASDEFQAALAQAAVRRREALARREHDPGGVRERPAPWDAPPPVRLSDHPRSGPLRLRSPLSQPKAHTAPARRPRRAGLVGLGLAALVGIGIAAFLVPGGSSPRPAPNVDTAIPGTALGPAPDPGSAPTGTQVAEPIATETAPSLAGGGAATVPPPLTPIAPRAFTGADLATPIAVIAADAGRRATLSGWLGETGFQSVTERAAPFGAVSDVVRFYDPADADLARSLAARLNARVEDLTSYRPRPGGPDIWLSAGG